MQKQYLPPVFHVVYADKEQMMLMMSVFDTLYKSNISFCVVKRDDFSPENVYVIRYGDIEQSEINDILEEIANVYDEDYTIKHIYME